MIVSFVVFDVPGTMHPVAHLRPLQPNLQAFIADRSTDSRYSRVSAMALMFTCGLLVLTLAYHRLMRHAGRFMGRDQAPLGRVRLRSDELRSVAIAAVGLYFLCRRCWRRC